MSTSDPRAPRPSSGVIEDALRLYRASFRRWWALALIGAVLNAWASNYQTRSLSAVPSLSVGDLVALSPDDLSQLVGRLEQMLYSRGLWLSSLLLLCVWLVICAALISRQHATAIGREDSNGTALASALRRLPSALTAAVILVLLTCAGMLLLLVPGFWLAGMLQLWLVPLCVEDIGPLRALGRSWQLVQRHWWYTSTVVGVAVTIVALPALAADLMTGGLASDLLASVGTALLMPLLTAVMLVIYYDLKARREGSDLNERLRSLQGI